MTKQRRTAPTSPGPAVQPEPAVRSPLPPLTQSLPIARDTSKDRASALGRALKPMARAVRPLFGADGADTTAVVEGGPTKSKISSAPRWRAELLSIQKSSFFLMVQTFGDTPESAVRPLLILVEGYLREEGMLVPDSEFFHQVNEVRELLGLVPLGDPRTSTQSLAPPAEPMLATEGPPSEPSSPPATSPTPGDP